MPITDIFLLTFIIFAFVVFAVLLAWGDYQTREIARASRQRALSGAHAASLTSSVASERPEREASEKSKAPAQ